MMTVTQYFHFPNNTELGKGNTHECYLLIPNSYDLSKIFPSGEEVEVIDSLSQRKYYLKAVHGREFRINQFGQLYRDYDVHMGDEIILTHIDGEERRTYVSVIKHNRIVIKQGRNGGEIINIERLTPFQKGNEYEIPIIWEEQELLLTIQYKEALAKRNDSPELTDYYTVMLGNSILQNGSYLLTLGDKNELVIFEKTNIISFPFDESIIIKKSVAPNTTHGINPYHQIIYYGAPGTGKSHEVKKQTGELLENEDEVDLPNVFRTTFHPDTDYASFVGCYKPAMESKEPIYTLAQLIDKLSIIKNSGASYPCQKFGAKYWESLKELSANDFKQILTACGFTDSMSVEIPKGIAIGEDSAGLSNNKQIVYRFVPQVFTDAYIYAYTTKEPTYLVIEEINRGNCAQIFGDLFQLLDRKGGVSEYKIKADKDLAQYLREKLGTDSEGIQDGKLCLPANLYILATMNTSDQSLFPMDSAFKRRWEWEYVPINYDENIPSGQFKVTIGDKSYSWVGFIEKVNEKIFDLTQSEDKQMGNFFIKQSIDEKGFKSKVMFYLWYEVLRDETENNKYFFYKKTTVEGKEVSSKFTFKDLFGDKATETLQQFMDYLEVAPK